MVGEADEGDGDDDDEKKASVKADCPWCYIREISNPLRLFVANNSVAMDNLVMD